MKLRRSAATVLIMTVALVLAACSSSGKTTTTTSKAANKNSATTSKTSSKAAAPTCPNADGSSARQTKFTSAPGMCIDASKTYTATMVTDDGTITIALDAKNAPVTVNNFVFLSRYHFYDGLSFHRVVTGFVVQGGDPTGTGQGGPGYEFKDELPSSNTAYKEGTLAMANSGPNTNGSQFFFVLSDAAGQQLTPDYSVFGQATSGIDVLHKIEADGSSGSDGTPTKVHDIKTVTISEN